MVRDAWGSLMTWAPSSIRVAVAVLAITVLATKVLPPTVRLAGSTLGRGWAPLVSLFTYPEYLLTSLMRRFGRRPLPGTFTFGRMLGSVAAVGTGFGLWLGRRFEKRPSFPVKTMLAIVAVLAGSWYVAPELPVGAARTTLTNVNGDITRVDTWLSTGEWRPPTCTCPTTTTARPRAKPKVTPTPKSTTRRK